MNKDKNCIAFLGLKNCGKGYNSKPFIEKGFVKIDLADSLRDLLWGILGYEPKDYSEFKKTDFGINAKIFKFFNKFYTITNGRLMLQNLGTEIKKLFGLDAWCNILKNKILNNNGNVVVTDVRFINEIKTIKSLSKNGYEVTFVWCCYDGADFNNILKDTHESEALAQFMYYNRDKYSLKDAEVIPTKTLNKIIKDYEQKSK